MLLIFIGVQVLPAAMYNYTILVMALFGQGQDFLLQVFRLFLVTVVVFRFKDGDEELFDPFPICGIIGQQ